MNIKKLFLAWQNPENRCWFPIGLLTFDGEYYQFTYTIGVEKAQVDCNFKLLHSFPKKDRIYRSEKIFPLFANRLMPSSRPDYPNYIKSLNLRQNQAHPMNILARSGGKKVTDTFEIFPFPEKNKEGNFEIYFFINGLRYMPKSSQDYINKLEKGERLFLTQDYQNEYDNNALLLRTKNGQNFGYCPRYLTENLVKLLRLNNELIKVSVEKINLPPTPIQCRLLCRLTTIWDDDFIPFNNEDYQPIFKRVFEKYQSLV